MRSKTTPWASLRRKYRDLNALDWDKSQRDDRLMLEIMTRLLKPTSNVIDIGANVGDVVSHVLDLAPRGTHYAFEPLPDLATRLRGAYPDVKVMEIALSDDAGDASYNYCVNKPGWSGFQNWGNLSAAETKAITVTKRRLDDVLPKDYRVDFIKLDVEGAELQVLRGAVETIGRWQPPVFFEHGCGAADAFGTTPEMIYEFFSIQCGYQVYNLRRWLRNQRPYLSDEFARAFREHRAWNFLAAAPDSQAR